MHYIPNIQDVELGGAHTMDIDSYRGQLAQFEFDRVTAFYHEDCACDFSFHRVYPEPVVDKDLFPHPDSEAAMCCSDAQTIHRIPDPCCSLDVFYYHDIPRAPKAAEVFFKEVSEIAHFRLDRASFIDPDPFLKNFGQLLDLGHILKELIRCRLAPIVFSYIEKRDVIGMLAELWRVRCPTHFGFLDQAFSTYTTYTPQGLIYKQPELRVACLSKDLNNFCFTYLEDSHIITRAATWFSKQLTANLDVVRYTDPNRFDNLLPGAIVGPHLQGWQGTQASLFVHQIEHTKYFHAWDWLMRLCISPDLMVKEILDIIGEIVHLPHVLGRNDFGARARLRRLKAVIKKEVLFPDPPLYRKNTVERYRWEPSNEGVVQYGDAGDWKCGYERLFKFHYGYLPAIHSVPNRSMYVEGRAPYCVSCGGTTEQWNALSRWADFWGGDKSSDLGGTTPSYSPTSPCAATHLAPLSQPESVYGNEPQDLKGTDSEGEGDDCDDNDSDDEGDDCDDNDSSTSDGEGKNELDGYAFASKEELDAMFAPPSANDPPSPWVKRELRARKEAEEKKEAVDEERNRRARRRARLRRAALAFEAADMEGQTTDTEVLAQEPPEWQDLREAQPQGEVVDLTGDTTENDEMVPETQLD